MIVLEIILLVCAIPCLLIGIISIYNQFIKYRKMEFVKYEAEIKEYEKALFEEKYHPVIEYILGDKKYRFVLNIRLPKKGEVGKKVKIKYNKDNPSQALLDKEKNAIIFFIVGILFLVAFVVVKIFI